MTETTVLFRCRKCSTEITFERRAHFCRPVQRPAVYWPNIGQLTKQVDPDYRKRFGSRPKRFRRTAVLVTPVIDLGAVEYGTS